MTPEAIKRRSLIQILLLTAGLLVLVAISVSSIVLSNRARDDSAWVTHTVEVESQLSTVLLEIRRAESAVRGYLLASSDAFLNEYRISVAAVRPGLNKLADLTSDNPEQRRNIVPLREAIEGRLGDFERGVQAVEQNDRDRGVAAMRSRGAGDMSRSIRDAANAMRVEEERLFALRTASADRSQALSSLVTLIGSGLVIALAALSIFLVRKSAHARDAAEARLRLNNLNLESTVDERTADLREANEEIQRFAYIVSHDLRSPLVNIMGFTSELSELRADIFKRIGTLSHPPGMPPGPVTADDDEDFGLEGDDRRLSSEFNEALGFIKSSIGKMDRLISAILNLTREGRRTFKPETIDMKTFTETIVSTMAHQAGEAEAQIRIRDMPQIVSDRLALEQIFGNLIDNALKYLKSGVPGDISVSGRMKLGFAVFEVSDNGRGVDPRDHQRIFDLFRRAGTQDKAGQGIGLAHVRALVRRLGGTISVASELGKGSTFTITLPAKWTISREGKDA